MTVRRSVGSWPTWRGARNPEVDRQTAEEDPGEWPYGLRVRVFDDLASVASGDGEGSLLCVEGVAADVRVRVRPWFIGDGRVRS